MKSCSMILIHIFKRLKDKKSLSIEFIEKRTYFINQKDALNKLREEPVQNMLKIYYFLMISIINLC